MLKPRTTTLMAAAACFVLCSGPQAQESLYPTKPVRVVVATAPGGGTDIQARMFAAKIHESLGQQFLIDNRGGGGGTVGYGFVAKAAPDGYTLLAVTPTFAYFPALYPEVDYDPVKGFAHISYVTKAPYLLLVHAGLPINSIKDWVAHAKANPGKLNLGTSGSGGFTHLAGAWLSDLAKININYVPYKGNGPLLGDLASGRLDAAFSTAVSAFPLIKQGKARVVGVSTSKRSTIWPDIPTIAEAGFPEYDLNTWHGWVAPAGTPAAIVNKVSVEVGKAVHAPEVAKRLATDGTEPVGSTPAEFRQLLMAEVPRWRRVIANANIKAD